MKVYQWSIVGLIIVGLIVTLCSLISTSEEDAFPKETTPFTTPLSEETVCEDAPITEITGAEVTEETVPIETENVSLADTEVQTEPETELPPVPDEQQFVDTYSYDIYHVARVVWGEARGCGKMEQSAVVWCVLNRYDAGYGSIYNIITAPDQFAYMYVEPGTEILDLTKDVFERWQREQAGETDICRTLPKEYRYFWGDDYHNYFRINITDQIYWDWSLPNPYEN